MNDLIQKLESYNWVDELGHPLVNCVEWEELKDKILKMEFMYNSLKNTKCVNVPKQP